MLYVVTSDKFQSVSGASYNLTLIKICQTFIHMSFPYLSGNGWMFSGFFLYVGP